MTDLTSGPDGRDDERGERGTDDRRDELVAAALARELTPAEEAELTALEDAHPDVAVERAELAAIVERLGGVGSWEDAAPSDDLAARVAAIEADVVAPERDGDDVAVARPVADLDAPAQEPLPAPVPLASRRRRGLLLPIAAGAAACLVIGVGIGAVAFGSDDGTDLVEGPPGTLGALEQVHFVGQPSAVDIDAALVAHTWGTETMLEIDGLPTGSAFTVVVVGDDGSEFESGTFLGSEVPIDCRLNAAVLREDVASVEIRLVSGDEVAHADVVDV
jgi:hypothetical protein